MEVNVQFLAPPTSRLHYPRGKSPWYALNRGWVGLRAGEERNSCSYRVSNPGRTASSLVTILTELSLGSCYISYTILYPQQLGKRR